MATTPAQPPITNSPPPSPPVASPPLDNSSPSNNATSPSTPAISPPVTSPLPPSAPPPNGATPPVTTSPPAPNGTPPLPPPPQPLISSPPPSISPPPPSPSVQPPQASPPPPSPALVPPLPSSPPPASVPPLRPSLSPPISQRSPPPPSERPTQSPPPSSPPSERPTQSPPSPSPPSERPTQSPPPPSSSPPSERPIQSPPPPSSPSPPSERPTQPPTPSPSPPLERPTQSPPSPPSERPTQSPPPPPSRSSVPPNSSPSSDSSQPPPSPSQIQVPGSGNPSQNNPSLSPPDSQKSIDGSGIGTVAVIGISVAVALVVFSLLGVFVWCLRRREKRLSVVSGDYATPSPMSSTARSDSAFFRTQSSAPVVAGKRSGSHHSYISQSQSGGLGNSKALFSFEELVKATDGFSHKNLLGEGGFGSVYKGILPDGRVVAVKQLKTGGGQGDREFKAEVETLSRIHHRHLVSIVGHCISGDRRLLIYDYVPNSDLYFHLHTASSVLDWAARVKIAAGAARGIAYLHEDCHPRIIHRDIKSSNILLEDNFDARVSDFGLARLALDCNTHITTRVIGTFGYMAPEYASSGKLTEKSDVFSFGVVLLELITGRKPVDTSQPMGEESLVEWARPLISHAIETEEFDSLADPKLEGKYVDSEMFRMIEAAGACVRNSAAKRPRMGQIVRAFESLAGEDLTNGMRLGESEIFNSAQQSAEIKLFRRMAFGSQNYSTDFFTHRSYNSRDENV